MRKDKIKCMNCGKVSIDTTEVKMQDSRNGKFKNMCPFCYGTNTVNLHEDTKAKDKFIYDSDYIHGETHLQTKMKKRIRRPILETEFIAKKVLGYRKSLDIKEQNDDFPPGRTLPMNEPIRNEDYFQEHGATTKVTHTKPFTPLELMQQKLNNQHEELKSKPNNYKLYRGWHYHRRIKKC